MCIGMLVSCKSKEDKALALIDKEMFKTLYDYESYEPVDTKIGSAFYSPYTNYEILGKAALAYEAQQEGNKAMDEYKSAYRTAQIWSDSWSSYSRSQYKEAIEEAKEHLDEVKKYYLITFNAMKDINGDVQKLPEGFQGWAVTHRFRCKTKGGYSSLGTNLYIMDKDVKEILFSQDIEDDDYSEYRAIIEYSITHTQQELQDLIDQMDGQGEK